MILTSHAVNADTEVLGFRNTLGWDLSHICCFSCDAGWSQRRRPVPLGPAQRPRREVLRQADHPRHLRNLLRAPPGRWHGRKDHCAVNILTIAIS